jgi:hypothetical protein
MAAAAHPKGTLRQQDRPPAQAETLLTDMQRRMMFGLLAAGIGYVLIALLLPPRGAVFWVAFFVGAPVLGVVAALFGKRRGLDAWLLTGGKPKQAAQPVAAATLPDAQRQALRVAVVPVLLGELMRAAPRLQAAEQAAAGRLVDAAVAAWNAASDDAARQRIATALPPLVGGLLAGGADAVRAAEAFAASAGGAR